MKPQMAAYYQGADLPRQAALLAVGISQAQAFLDGDKRTAFIAMATSLIANGVALDRVDPLEAAHQLEVVAERSDSLEAATARFEGWLREHLPQG